MLHDFFENTGLDWIPILLGLSELPPSQTPYPSTKKEIEDKFGELNNTKKLNEALEYSYNLVKREEDRLNKIEAKAFALTGVTGVASAFVARLALILFDSNITNTVSLIIVSILYISVALSLLLTILLAIKVVDVFGYRFFSPSPTDIFNLSQTTLHSVKYKRLIELFYSFVQNTMQVNRKATYLIGAQHWFKNSIILLLVFTIFLAVQLPIVKSTWPLGAPPTTPSGVTVTLTSSPSITPSSTAIPSSSATSIPITITPSIDPATNTPNINVSPVSASNSITRTLTPAAP